MDIFLTEVMDEVVTKDIFIKYNSFIDKEKCIFIYNNLFQSNIVQNALLYSFVYKQIFGIHPSKLDIKNTFSTFDDIMRYLVQNTLFKYFNKSNVESLKQDFNKYKLNLNETNTVKHELFIKLTNRINTKQIGIYDANKTLFELFKSLCDNDVHAFYANEKTLIENNKYLAINPLTNMELQNTNPIQSTYNVLTQIDAIKYIIAKDLYLFRKIANTNVVIILDDPHSIWKKTIDIVYKTFNPSFVLHITHTIVYHCIPKLMSKCIVISETESCPSSLLLKSNQCIYQDKTHEYEYYVQTLIKTYLSIPISIPPNIVNLFYEIHKDTDLKTTINPNSENAIFLIDNRENIMSVISLQITLSNLKSDYWSIVIMTTEKARPFYENYFGEKAVFITHPLQNKHKFDIEDYNLIMKDDYTWQQLDNLGKKNALIVQDDCVILRKGLEDLFLNKYDYIGPPWQKTQNLIDVGIKTFVGNGGLSLRNVKKMLEIAKHCKDKPTKMFNNNFNPIPEDVMFSLNLQNTNMGLPSDEEAALFGSEMILSDISIGIHKPWAYFKESNVIDYIRALKYSKPR